MKPLLLYTDSRTSKTDLVVTILTNIFIALVLAPLLVIYITIEPVEIVGASMENGLHGGDVVVINKFYFSPSRGDIVVIEQGDTLIIKRVVAVAGDRFGFVKTERYREDGSSETLVDLYLDQGDGFNRLNETYLKSDMQYNEFTMGLFAEYTVAESRTEMEKSHFYTVEKGRFLALGDNRNVSLDSRVHGAFAVSAIVGRQFAVLSPGSFWEKFFDFFYQKPPANDY